MKSTYNHTLLVFVLGSLLAGCGGEGEQQQSGNITAKVASIRFGNGEVLSTRVICNLKSQMAAGQEILYTATSVSSPYFDVTVFGPNSMFEGGKVSWVETTDFKQYQTRWASAPTVIGDSFTISLEGSTIRGSGTLVRGKDETGKEGEKREARLEVDCSD